MFLLMLSGHGGIESEVQKLVTLAIGNEKNWDKEKLEKQLEKLGRGTDKRKSTVENSADRLVKELQKEKENATAEDFIDQIRENGTKLIVSYSKAANIISKGKYPIFNARISAALNAIQIIEGSSQSQYDFFPILPSNDREIDEFNSILRKYIREYKHKFIDSSIFYEKYISILRWVSYFKKIDLELIETILSSYSDVLVKQSKKKIYKELKERDGMKKTTSIVYESQTTDDGFVDCETSIHGKTFRFKVDEEDITIKREMGKNNKVYQDRFSKELLNEIFHYVVKEEEFILDNNVIDFNKILKKKKDVEGLGSFVFTKHYEMTEKKDSRLGQAVSHLASIMEKAKLLELNRGKPARFKPLNKNAFKYFATIKNYYDSKQA